MCLHSVLPSKAGLMYCRFFFFFFPPWTQVVKAFSNVRQIVNSWVILFIAMGTEQTHTSIALVELVEESKVMNPKSPVFAVLSTSIYPYPKLLGVLTVNDSHK